MEKTKIVIVGAGYGGVATAKALAKKYKKNEDVEITLIDRNYFHTLMTELHEVAAGRVDRESVQVELGKIFAKTKVNVVIDEINEINTDTKIVVGKNDNYTYDYVVIGTGSQPSFYGVPGVKENSYTLWSFEDAIRLKKRILEMFEKAQSETDVMKRRQMLTFAIAGAGFTGIEMAGELAEFAEELAAKYSIAKNEYSIYVIEALGKILNMLDEKGAAKAEKYLAKKGVQVLKNSPIVELTPDMVKIKDREPIPTNTLIWTAGIQANEDSCEYGLCLGKAGRIEVNKFLQPIDIDNGQPKSDAFVVGDISWFEESPGKGNPQIVENAMQTGQTAAKNIINSIEGKPLVEHNPKYHGFMVSIGSRYSVADTGFKSSGFIATAIKHLVNLHYLFGIGGIALIWKYMQHEFFHRENRRSLVGRHLSEWGNMLFLVPLRLFLGVMWFLEGFKKLVGDETIQNAKSLGDYFKIGKGSWFEAGAVKMPFAWLYDATSKATAAAETATDAVSSATGAAGPKPILSEMPGIFESIMKIMIPNQEIAMLFQKVVVLTEIALGLALIAGLFTFIAGAVSAFMTLNFILSAMASWDILWYTFSSIAVMAGAGRSLGLDYYVLPWVRKIWDRIAVGKVRPIYDHKKSA